ncbi:hypothetical protein, partial [Desulfovibrio psychrotolerans]|uniref:hypothetical protein n=1 Tax=Desulfovibrio psychrotolerans TaxID=415242 RepID=UPI001964A68A
MQHPIPQHSVHGIISHAAGLIQIVLYLQVQPFVMLLLLCQTLSRLAVIRVRIAKCITLILLHICGEQVKPLFDMPDCFRILPETS